MFFSPGGHCCHTVGGTRYYNMRITVQIVRDIYNPYSTVPVRAHFGIFCSAWYQTGENSRIKENCTGTGIIKSSNKKILNFPTDQS